MDELESLGMVFAILAGLIVFDKVIALLSGAMSLEAFLVPGWTGFATANPTLFGLILVVGTALFGRGFLAFVENV